jgi:hypothetical protein
LGASKEFKKIEEDKIKKDIKILTDKLSKLEQIFNQD